MTAPAPLDAHLGYWLRFVSNQVSLAFTRKLASHDIGVAEWVVLRELYDTAMAPSLLADRLGLTRGAVSKITDRLLDRGALAQTVNAEDRRSHALALTDAGRALVPELAALADANDAEFFGHLHPAERVVILNALREVARRRGIRAVPLA